jgi:hypothetical protein
MVKTLVANLVNAFNSGRPLGAKTGDKETLKLTYNAFCKPVILCAAPVYYPSLDPKSKIIARMQALQNNTMHVHQKQLRLHFFFALKNRKSSRTLFLFFTMIFL